MNTIIDSSPPQLLALDWGTSSVRAYLMRNAEVVVSRQSPHGIQHLPSVGIEGFKLAFKQIAGDWVQTWKTMPIVASGMVGSAQGWCEAPYVRCPADIDNLAARAVRVDSGAEREILIAPGVLFDENGELPDVMRGEEIQIAGALLRNPQWSQHSWMLLPGTHSKWAKIELGRIVRYTTYLTGELFAVLTAHSILGRLLPPSLDRGGKCQTESTGFGLGIQTATRSRPGELMHQIFATRTLGLTDRLPATELANYLSGLLIGHELISGLEKVGTSVPLVMIGAPALCGLYERGLRLLGRCPASILDNTAPIGLWNFAKAAGLLGGHYD